MLTAGDKFTQQNSHCKTINHDDQGQDPAKQEHHQEKEGGGRGAKRLQRRPTVVEESDLWRKVASEPKPANI